MLPPAIHSFSEQQCHDNPHVTGYKHTTILQGFASEETQIGVTHTFFLRPQFAEMHQAYPSILPCGNSYFS